MKHRAKAHARTRVLAVLGAGASVVLTAAILPYVSPQASEAPLTPAAATPEITATPPAPSIAPSGESTVTPSASSTGPATGSPSSKPAKKKQSDGWRLVWADEFNGSSINRGKWNLRNGEHRDIDKGCNVSSAANTFVRDGRLTLRALRKQVACGSQTRQFTQSYLDTIGKHTWTYGRFEIRAKSPNKPDTSTGLWPAFWLRPQDGGNGEIDVTELPGGRDWYGKSTAAIFFDYTPVKQDTRIALPGGGYPGDGFHTYATEWTKDSLTWYIDGQRVWTRDRNTTPFFDKVFHKPYNLRLNFQVGGWLGDPDANTAFPADFVVDHVRVYQR